MSSPTVDLFLTYQFLRRLATPFKEWDAYKLGIIDEDGKVLQKNKKLNSKEKAAWSSFDKLVANLKKLLAMVPGGKSRIATYAAALLLIKEHNNLQNLNDDEMELFVEQNYMQILTQLTEDGEGSAAAPVNTVSGGKVAGLGVGPQGEPGVKKKRNPVLAKMIKRNLPNVGPKLPT